MKLDKKMKTRILAVAGSLLLFLVLYVDDWRRDFVSHEARIAADTRDPTLRPLNYPRSSAEVTAAIKMAARRIRNWRFAGEVVDGDTTLLYFVRTNRLLRIKDDVILRVEDRGRRRVVTGESRGRLPLGDLGRNTRNLRRLRHELALVLEGSAPGPFIDWSTGRH
jgi:uncharacterized protein (DUF1499 family)